MTPYVPAWSFTTLIVLGLFLSVISPVILVIAIILAVFCQANRFRHPKKMRDPQAEFWARVNAAKNLK